MFAYKKISSPLTLILYFWGPWLSLEPTAEFMLKIFFYKYILSMYKKSQKFLNSISLDNLTKLICKQIQACPWQIDPDTRPWTSCRRKHWEYFRWGTIKIQNQNKSKCFENSLLLSRLYSCSSCWLYLFQHFFVPAFSYLVFSFNNPLLNNFYIVHEDSQNQFIHCSFNLHIIECICYPKV